MTEPILHPLAEDELDKVWDYIAQFSMDAADRVTDEISDAIEGLTVFPHRGHFRADLAGREVRFVTVRSYLIAYAPAEQPLLVLAILLGTRSPRTLKRILRTRLKAI